MRNLVKIVLLISLSAGFTSCEMVRGWFEVEFDSTLNGDLNIDVQESVKKSTNSHGFQASTTLSLLDDEEIARYEDNINEIEVTGIVAEVTYLSTSSVIFSSETSFTITDGSSTVNWTLGNDWTVFQGAELSLEDLGGTYDLVKEILDKHGEFQVSTVGECSESGVSITIQIGIDVIIKASPL